MNPPSLGTSPPAALKLGALLGLAVFSGLIAGLAQVALVLAIHLAGPNPRMLGPNLVWMMPTATAGLFVLAALVLAAAGRLSPRLASPTAALAVFGFLAVLGLALYKGGVHPAADAILSAGGASVLVRALRSRVDWLLRLVRRFTPWLAGLVVLLAAGVVAAPLVAERRAVSRLGPPVARINVILVILDAVRAQSLGLYGYARPTTPNLERWAKRGVVFQRAVAPSSWSLPSHASMLTGRSPLQLSADWGVPLDDTYPTLAEYLRSRGYLTAGFVANPSYCSRPWGLARGFVHYEDFPLSLGELLASSRVLLEGINSPWIRRLIPYRDYLGRKTAASINRDFLGWLDRRPARPFFAFLNYFDAHEPVVVPPEFEQRFPSPAPRRWDILDYQLHQALRVKPSELSPSEIRAEINAYDAAIASLDQRVSELLDQLDRRGLLDTTVIFITSDHGERHGEQGRFGHGGGPSRLLTQVPLLMLRPDRRTGVVDEFVSLRDVAATALDVAGITNDGTFPRCSFDRLANLSPLDGAARAAGCPTVTAEVPNKGKPWAAVYQTRFHFIAGPKGLERLYDWDADPSESTDLAQDPGHQAVAAQMRRVTDSLLMRDHRPTAGPGLGVPAPGAGGR
jgi:arylsulfatase A-like enzyme